MLTVEDRPQGYGGTGPWCRGGISIPSHETQRLAPGRAKSKVPRVRASRAGEGKVPGTASTHVTGGRTSGIVGMLGPWCRLTSRHQPQNWRAADPSTSWHQPHNLSGRRLLF